MTCHCADLPTLQTRSGPLTLGRRERDPVRWGSRRFARCDVTSRSWQLIGICRRLIVTLPAIVSNVRSTWVVVATDPVGEFPSAVDKPEFGQDGRPLGRQNAVPADQPNSPTGA